MISLPSGTRIWLVAGVTDMRKSFNGLGEQVQHVLNDNPFSGHLFIFRGRRGDTEPPRESWRLNFLRKR